MLCRGMNNPHTVGTNMHTVDFASNANYTGQTPDLPNRKVIRLLVVTALGLSQMKPSNIY